MEKSKKGIILLITIFIAIVALYAVTFYADITSIAGALSNQYVFGIALLLVILIICYTISLIRGRNKAKELKYRDKLFSTLVENSNTVYIMIENDDNNIVYLSKNVEDVLGIDAKNNKTDADTVKEVLNIPILKEELKNWDGKSEYVSGMLSYDTPKYQHTMWINVKMYPYKEKKYSYTVIQISDVTKDHDRQHMLITQTTDIKSRERQLDQITASSYDVEINLNIATKKCEITSFKEDTKYFGIDREGNYEEELEEIVKKYINNGDWEEVNKVLSINNFETLLNEKKYSPIKVRFRLGNDVKDSIWLESTAFFITNRDTNYVSILTKNVTENVESIREQNIMLQNTLNDAKEANEAKNDLISTISHDIRTPMTTIIGLSDSILGNQLNDNIREDVTNINDSSKEVLDIIDGLLDISKIEKKAIKNEEKPYKVETLFNKISKLAKDYIGSKKIDFILDLDSNLPVVLSGDSKRINQILNVVVNNAVKFTDEGQIKLSVNGTKKNNDEELVISIKDTGCGIAREELDKLFTSNEKSSNEGLGRVKKIIELLNGTIEIESKEGEYTEVKITLIQKIVEDNKVREMMYNVAEEEIFNLNGKSILLADDNKLNLKVAVRILEPYELTITTVGSGQECIDLINKGKKFDLILLDQMMPGMDGKATLDKLKEKPGFYTPVVALTADAMVGQREKYLSEGFNDYLSKPIDKKELSRILKKYVKKDM